MEMGHYGLSRRTGGSQFSEGKGGWGWDGWCGVSDCEMLGCAEIGGGGGNGGPLD